MTVNGGGATYAPFDLTGKVALITGGNGGIGLGMAEGLARAGAAVAIWGRDATKLDKAAGRLSQYGAEVHAAVVDVSDAGAVASAVDATVRSLGRIDSVFANAGVGGRTRFLDLDAAELHRVLAIDLDGALWTLREAARHMVARAEAGDPGGSLVTTSSVSAVRGAPTLQSYAAAKGALVSVTKGLAAEFGRHGIRANTIIPGWIRTEMTEGSFERPEVREAILKRVPIRRWGTSEDFAGVAVYLASDASAYHTGDTLVVDGGYTTS
ncbi:SDR family oxidoreductase [Phytohabitans sp. ZYX-F-186]|uniref:SDR family oxidoreductase n=1 Tax=Phytohabitans maris TaxID=3071409 RepID=A0ABU0ZDU4_9ACTN|nr:SDR family oxidoreductase [Phytohabitans sp. ZYX-F-186]MDQ7905224.1 SDR family oxidoreductase [Phytohabitans sp. ZYX-F-186]